MRAVGIRFSVLPGHPTLQASQVFESREVLKNLHFAAHASILGYWFRANGSHQALAANPLHCAVAARVKGAVRPRENVQAERTQADYRREPQMVMKVQTQTDLVKAIADIAAAMPMARTVQLYEFALFLKSHPLPAEETFEEIAADEALWDTQFAATDDDKLAALVASVEAEINEGATLPMFDEDGEFLVLD